MGGDLKTYVFVLKTSDGGEEREAVVARDDAHARALAEITALVAGVADDVTPVSHPAITRVLG